ncbi:MAG: hypothetical protein Q8O93_02365 [bacterium]|nr:hypothetical protein [bacterium]
MTENESGAPKVIFSLAAGYLLVIPTIVVLTLGYCCCQLPTIKRMWRGLVESLR